jgi:FkbM family methyltransferase
VDLAEYLFCYGEYYLPVRHFEPSVFFYKHGLAHVQNPEKLKDKDILDIGGFIGDSVLVLSPYTNRTVYSFEAVAGQRQLMQKTLELNKIKNAKIVPLALGSRKESVEIIVNGSSSCISKDNFARAVREKVDMDTLDNYVVQNGIQVGLIKVDIEGFEQEFLKGAVNTIKTQKPVLVLSIYHNWSDFFDIKPMIESWNLGYKFKIVKPIDGAILAETLLIAEVR